MLKHWSIRNKRLSLKSPLIMGILNVTNDSFSDGGRFKNSNEAVEGAIQLVNNGADIIDIGGESTRPGSKSISVDEEMNRVLPVVEKLVQRTDIPISIDTQKPEVAKEAIRLGAHIINDVSSGLHDSHMFDIIAHTGVGYIMMHMQGRPESMQENPAYSALISDINNYFARRIQTAKECGIHEKQIVIDPGIGFGKSLDDNILLLNNLQQFGDYPVVIGTSRKSFINMIHESPTGKRIGGSIASNIYAMNHGANILRVHDVFEMKQAIEVWQILNNIGEN